MNPWENDKFKTKVTIINALRKASRFHGRIKECKQNASIAPNTYLCAGCNMQINTNNTKLWENEDYTYDTVAIDHIDPIAGLTGFPKREGNNNPDWNKYIDNLFFGELQLLCGSCHYSKSEVERQQRYENK